MGTRRQAVGLGLALGLAAAWAGCSKEKEADPAMSTEPGVKEEAPWRAALEQLRGEVTVKRAAGDEWVTASETMKLFENDKLRTARGASVVVRFRNGSSLKVGEDALVGIAEVSRTGAEPSDITVLKGRIDATLSDPKSQSLVVSTPSAMVRAGREIVFQ